MLSCEEECSEFSPRRKDKLHKKPIVRYTTPNDDDDDDRDYTIAKFNVPDSQESDEGKQQPSLGLGLRFFSFSQAHWPWRQPHRKLNQTKDISKSLDCLNEDSRRNSGEHTRPITPPAGVDSLGSCPVPFPQAFRQPVMPVNFPRRPARAAAKKDSSVPQGKVDQSKMEVDGAKAPPDHDTHQVPSSTSPTKSNGKLKIRPMKVPAVDLLKCSRSVDTEASTPKPTSEANSNTSPETDTTDLKEKDKPLPGNKFEGAYEAVSASSTHARTVLATD